MNGEKQLQKLINSALFKGNPIYYDKEDTYCLVEMHKKEIELNKPIYLGFSIDLKTVMYDFHYGYIKRNMVIKLNYYLPILKLKIFMKIILKNVGSLTLQIRKYWEI